MTSRDDYASSANFDLLNVDGEWLLVLLHGLGGNRQQALGLIEGFADPRLAVLAPDLRAHGDSLIVGSAEAFTFDAMVADLAALIDRLGQGSKPTIVAGISMGAALALRIALAGLFDVRGIALVRPAFGDRPNPPNLAVMPVLARLFDMEDPDEARRELLDSPEYKEIAAVTTSGARSVEDQLELLSKPLDGVDAEQAAAEGAERLVDIVTTFIPHRQSPKLVEPRDRALPHPAVPAQLRLRLDPLARDAHLDVAPGQRLPAARIVIPLVSMELDGALAGAATPLPDRPNGIDHLREQPAVVLIRAGDPGGQRRAASIRDHVVFGAGFAPIGGVRTGFGAPFLAGTLALSTHARLQSIWSARPSSSSSVWCSRSQTPARCQSRRRRQQVMPEPQPISWGSSSQGMPDLSTKMMPVRQARSGTRGRPPFGLGGSSGSNGATRVHRASGSNGLLMLDRAATHVPRF